MHELKTILITHEEITDRMLRRKHSLIGTLTEDDLNTSLEDIIADKKAQVVYEYKVDDVQVDVWPREDIGFDVRFTERCAT